MTFLRLLGVSCLLLSCASPAPSTPAAPKAAGSSPPALAPDPESFRLTQPPPGPVTELSFPAAASERLPGGLTLMVLRRPAGIVSLSVVVRGGASAVPEGKSGLSALTARMMTEGTTSRSALALAEAAESMGSVLEQSAARDSIRLGISVERRDLDRALALLADVLQKPAFAPSDLERVRTEWLDSIEAERQAPSRLSSLVGLRLLLGPAVGAPVSGSRTDVKGLRRDDLVAFHRRSVTAENTAVIVVGDVGLADVKPTVVRLFSGVRSSAKASSPPVAGAAPAPAQSTPPPPRAEGAKGPRVVVLDRPGAVQSALFLAQPFPRRSEPGHEARQILNGLIGGLFTSRLNTKLREEQAYTYGARSVGIATRGWGAFAVMTSVRTDVTGAALVDTLGELRALRSPSPPRPVTQGEVLRARLDLVQSLGATLAHTSDLAGSLEELFVHDLPADYHHNYPLLLNVITAGEIQQEAQRLDPDRLISVVVGDRSAIEPQLSGKGFTVEAAPESLAD